MPVPRVGEEEVGPSQGDETLGRTSVPSSSSPLPDEVSTSLRKIHEKLSDPVELQKLHVALSHVGEELQVPDFSSQTPADEL